MSFGRYELYRRHAGSAQEARVSLLGRRNGLPLPGRRQAGRLLRGRRRPCSGRALIFGDAEVREWVEEQNTLSIRSRRAMTNGPR